MLEGRGVTQWLSSGARFAFALPLRRFNRLPTSESKFLLRQCLSVDRWVDVVSASRPYKRLDDLFEVARDAAFPFTPAELEAALASVVPQPVIPAVRRQESAHQRWLRAQLAAGVAQYERRFGRAFLLRREGRDDTQVLMELWMRLDHDLDTEDRVLAQQVREHALAALARLISD